MAVITAPTYDPKTTAENLANAYIAPTKAILESRPPSRLRWAPR